MLILLPPAKPKNTIWAGLPAGVQASLFMEHSIECCVSILTPWGEGKSIAQDHPKVSCRAGPPALLVHVKGSQVDLETESNMLLMLSRYVILQVRRLRLAEIKSFFEVPDFVILT